MNSTATVDGGAALPRMPNDKLQMTNDGACGANSQAAPRIMNQESRIMNSTATADGGAALPRMPNDKLQMTNDGACGADSQASAGIRNQESRIMNSTATADGGAALPRMPNDKLQMTNDGDCGANGEPWRDLRNLRNLRIAVGRPSLLRSPSGELRSPGDEPPPREATEPRGRSAPSARCVYQLSTSDYQLPLGGAASPRIMNQES
ncbi:MAG: hypothetical protein R6X33_14400 [Candidatus Brocadiia bacterium]